MTATELTKFSEIKDPMTLQWCKPVILEDHFAPGVSGVKFGDGTIYNPDVYKLKFR